MSTVSRPALKPRTKLRMAKRQALIERVFPCRDEWSVYAKSARRLLRGAGGENCSLSRHWTLAGGRRRSHDRARAVA
jgi:hypothetical protein